MGNVVASSTPTCEICGRRWRPDAEPEEWLGVEVDRGGSRLYAVFCSQEHAHAWFASPLPQAPPPVQPPPLAGSERALILGVGTLGVLVVAVFMVGAVAIVRTVLDWL
jgi:hypothetical protein